MLYADGGGLTNSHPGNGWFRRLVRSNQDLCNASKKHKKLPVNKAVVLRTVAMTEGIQDVLIHLIHHVLSDFVLNIYPGRLNLVHNTSLVMP